MTSVLKRAVAAVGSCDVMEVLREFSPEIVSTIWAGFDIPGSDIDIVCHAPRLTAFESRFEHAFSGRASYQLISRDAYSLGRFAAGSLLVEVYAANTPIAEQAAFRHFNVMKRLSVLGGEAVRREVRALKMSGLKTEPAIAKLLGLPGDPYEAVLTIESWSDEKIEGRLQAQDAR